MGHFLTIGGLALLPALGMVVGAIAAEWREVSRRSMGAVLHAAAGIAVAVVSVELMPRILGDIAPWLLGVEFAVGAVASVAMVRAVRHAVRALKIGQTGPWLVYAAVAVDLFGDGLMIGIGSAVSSGLGLMLGLSQVVANIPGGFVAVGNLRAEGVGRTVRLAATASLLVPVLIGAGGGFWLLRGESPQLQNAALASVAGLLLLATIEDLVPQADEPETRRWITTASFAAGFVFFMMLSLYFG